ncbi:hypothetical protein PI124_g21029 [Phytophthora idaei]|nr:hypothetical protein PI125_g25821 [Phytophthora idaei]KAG3123812.1 hypothetical protein PI126_g23538 [Phytophthora idaei]KAG3233903.1 hypothetical protein PI124_g21029 [Phytophthora idaei]
MRHASSAGALGLSDTSLTVPAAPSAVDHAFTPQSAFPGVSENTLRDIVDEAVSVASFRSLTTSATQLAPVAKALVRAMVQRPRSINQGFWDQFDRAQTVAEVDSAVAAGTSQVCDTSADVGKLCARLESAYAGRQALRHQLLTQAGLRDITELYAHQATAEIEELKADLKQTKKSDAAHLRRAMDAQATIDASTETASKHQKFVESVQDGNGELDRIVGRLARRLQGVSATSPQVWRWLTTPLAAAGLAGAPGVASDPSPTKRRGLRMPKA